MLHTAIAQFAAETAGVPFEKVELIVSDTATTGNSGSVSASRMTFMAGNSVKGAVLEALEKWEAEDRPAIAVRMIFSADGHKRSHRFHRIVMRSAARLSARPPSNRRRQSSPGAG